MFDEAKYSEVIEKLLSCHPSFGSVGATAYNPGLERMWRMCAILGHPEKKLRCIHVAGTNGKGSTCNMIAAHFASKGLRVGLYTSPHILDFRERVRIVEGGMSEVTDLQTREQSSYIPKQDVLDFIEKYSGDIETVGLSFFEITTSLALWYFTESKVDIAVMECGLGGRLDATNVISPEISIITNIGYDHMDILGHTLEKIAGEKAGIIKQGVPVLVGEADSVTEPVFRETARTRNAPLYILRQSSDSAIERLPMSCDLQGIYQVKNRRTVAKALELLGEKPDWNAIDNAAAICGFHGRWEHVDDDPVTICDIGHNEHGLKYNFLQLEALLDSGEYSDVVMVYGSVSDKDVAAVLRIIPQRAHLFLTQAANSRALAAAELLRMLSSVREAGHVEAFESVPLALEAARKYCYTLTRPLLYIGGSTYVVSEAMAVLNK